MIPIGSVMAGVNALSGLLGPLTRTGSSGGETATAPVAPATTAEPAAGASPSQTAEFRQILARYDVTQITPAQFSRMLGELRQTGALDEEDLSQLGQILVDLDAEGVDADEEVDLVEIYTDRLDKLQDRLEDLGSDEEAFAGVAPALAGVQTRLDWLTRFALAHSAPEAGGVDLLT